MDRARSSAPRIADVGLGAVGASVLAAAAAFAIWGIPPLPPAPMVALGVPSPLTGMTRSFIALAHGDVGPAFARHPLGPLCALACAAAAANLGHLALTGRRIGVLDRAVAWRGSGWLVALAFGIAWARQILVYG